MNGEIYEGHLIIKNSEDAAKYKNLTKVTGDLTIYASAKLDVPKLESVGGGLYIYSPTNAPKLESVGGCLTIHPSAKLDAPKLESIGERLEKDVDDIKSTLRRLEPIITRIDVKLEHVPTTFQLVVAVAALILAALAANFLV